MPICLSKITTSPPCHSSISETSVVRANAVCEKKHLQVSHPSEIYVCIRFCYHVILWLLPDSCIHKHLQVISGILQGISNYIGANAHNHRQDNRSHHSGFCILDVCSHRPVRRSEYQAGRLPRHHPDLRCYETAVFCPDSHPQAGTTKCAGNVSAHKIRCCKTVKAPVPLHNALLYPCMFCPNAYSHPFLL